MSKSRLLFLMTILSLAGISSAFAEDIKIPCMKADGSFGLRGLEKFDCELVKGLVKNDGIREDHEKKILDKLASQLATQAEQTIEEMALLDQYYSDYGESLLMSKAVEDSCQLQIMAKPACEGGSDQKKYDQKMKMIMSKFPHLDGNSLMEQWSKKFSAVREPAHQLTKENQCPLNQTSGVFLLNAQLTEYDVKIFIDNLKGDRSDKHTSDAGNSSGESFYSKYPQLKIIKSSDSGFRKKFEEYAKSYPGNGSYKDYLSKFFFNKENKEPLSSAVARQCGQITKNMKKFLCEDLKSLAIPELAAATSFFTTEEEAPDLQVSKGFSCDFQNKENPDDVSAILKQESAGAWNKLFTENTRVDGSKIASNRSINQFCSLYNCTDKLSKKLKSCENGGPVTSEDLEKSFCSTDGLECSTMIQQGIALLKPFEKDKKKKQTADKILAGKATAEEIKAAESAPARSAFSANFTRTDNSPSTPFVADKKLGLIPEERKYEGSTILEKKIEAGAQALAGKTETPKMERAQAPQQSVQDAPVQPRYDAFMAANNQAQESENARRALVNNLMKNSAKDTSVVAKRLDTTPDSDRTEEMRKLRAELADAINGVKGSEEERLAAATDYNRSVLSPRSMAADATKGLSQAERDRLDQYRDSLNTWEGRLRNWEGKLTDREMRGFGSSSAPSANAADNYRDERARAAQDGFGPSSESSGGLKLTKSAAGASGSVNGVKGEAATERAPGADGSDSEKGIVNSENLATLGKDSLKKLGIVVDETFIIRVRHKDKIYAIPVKTFSYKGKEMYVPILDDKNRDLAKIVFDSPLFSDYRQYQSEREQRK